jgi:hypothetical protein
MFIASGPSFLREAPPDWRAIALSSRVVKCESAHIDEVESELIVKSGHSTQGNPNTLEEVRRILRLDG